MSVDRPCRYLVAALLWTGPATARTWELPVMATWTEDPRTTVTLAWERTEAAPAWVVYGEEGSDSSLRAEQPEPAHRHVFTLRNLQPGTRYRYQVHGADGYEVAGRFWTAPADPARPFTFVLHNDLQGGINPAAAHAVAAGVIQADPDFVLSTGDLADSRYAADYGGVLASWRLFFECLGDELAQFVFQSVCGNHDEPENPDSFWHRLIELPDSHDYTFNVGSARFIMVDSTESEAPSRTAWLARELQRAAFDPSVTWVVPAFHRPPFSAGERGGDGSIRDWWVPLFTKYEADLVLSGHAHTYQRTRPIDGVSYLVSGGGGGWPYQVDPQAPFIAHATSTFHFAWFRVTPDMIEIEGRLPDGTVFDRGALAAGRHVRVEPVFPVRGSDCTIWYDPAGGPLAESPQVTLHLGRDGFSEFILDQPMERESATGRWRATCTVPESVKWHLAFCFFDPESHRWHNNHAANWQTLVAREW